MSDQPAVVNRQHVPGCSCDTANDDPALNVADPVCKEWTKIFHRWLAAHDEAIRAEEREIAELSWSSQVKKYADLVEAYQRSIDDVQASATERIQRARAEVAAVRERIAVAIEAAKCTCRDSYCSLRRQSSMDARIARTTDTKEGDHE